MRSIRCSIVTLTLLSGLGSVQLIYAQSAPLANSEAQITFGLMLPTDFNRSLNSGQDSSDSGVKMTQGGWIEGITFVSPMIALQTGAEMPRAYVTTDRHAGSGGFSSELHHRDFIIYELIGVHGRRQSKVGMVGVGGFGLVFSHTVDRQTTLVPVESLNGQVNTVLRSQLDPSFLGGIDVPIAINKKSALLFRVRGRVTLRRNNDTIDQDIFGWFSLTPSVGLRLNF